MGAVSDQASTVERNRRIGRFTLVDLVDSRDGAQVWRAVDSALRREVTCSVIPRDDDLFEDLKAATRTAATVEDRRLVGILDVFATSDEIVVITEWAPGEVLAHHLQEPLPAAEAARIAYEVARGIEIAHARGIAHGRLRPDNVIIGPDGEVRITGLGIDAVLAGLEPIAGSDPVRADLHGIGSILFACLTTRWPDDIPGMVPAPQVAGHVPPPSRLLADIPEALDDVCARTVCTIVAPRGRPRLTSAGQAASALAECLTDLARGPRPANNDAEALLPRFIAALGILLVLLGLGWLVSRVVAPTPTVIDAGGSAAQTSTTTPAAPTPSPTPSPVALTPYPIAGAGDFDPLGNQTENPSWVPLAHDGDMNTAWRTVTYYDDKMDGKSGVGLLVDLGAPQPVGHVQLALVGTGTDLQVLTSDQATSDPRQYALLGQATSAGEKVEVAAAAPRPARYVLVWLTSLPTVEGGWRGGIREVAVTG